MKNSDAPLNLPEVRKILKSHKREDLEFIIAEMYKMIPKAMKLENDLSGLIQSPAKNKNASKKKSTGKKLRPFAEIESETEFFCDNAYAQNYLAPNRIIKKSDRPKWRFTVNRLYKELVKYSKVEGYEMKSALLLQKLYEVLTYSCDYYLFTAYDSFDSVRITQSDFFQTIISIKEKHLSKPDFIHDSINLIINNPLNRYTLYSDLIDIFVSYLTIPDLNETTIKIAGDLYKEALKEKQDKDNFISEYDQRTKLNNLTEIVFKCYFNLSEYDKAIEYFNNHYVETEPEITLFVLVRLLERQNHPGLIVREIKNARKKGIKPRDELIKLLHYIEKNNKIPEYI